MFRLSRPGSKSHDWCFLQIHHRGDSGDFEEHQRGASAPASPFGANGVGKDAGESTSVEAAELQHGLESPIDQRFFSRPK